MYKKKVMPCRISCVVIDHMGYRILFICLVYLISVAFSQSDLSEEYIDTDEDYEEYHPPCANGTYNRTCCNHNEFQCSDGHCIPFNKLCDSKLDCLDNSDEQGCLSLPCSGRSTIKCDQECHDLPGNKSRCMCHKGFSLAASSFRQICKDIDECQIGVHLCTQGCENLNGTFRCTCKEGFTKNDDGLPDTCKAEDQNIQVLYSSDSWIYSYSVKEHKVKPVVHAGRVDEMDYDPATDMIYWSTRHRVARSYLLGAKDGVVSVGHPQSVGPSSIWHVKNSLAIDWTAGNLYWISVDILNVEKYQILVSKVDGRYVKTLLDDVSFASSLIVDPENGKMYWTSGGDNAEIGGAWMNGMYRRTVLKLYSTSPIALTLDHMTSGRLFWADSKDNAIYFVNTDGTRLTKVITTTAAQTPLMMDVFENYLYWVTKESNQLVKMDKFGRGNITNLVEQLIHQTSVKIYHKRRVEVEIRKAGLYCKRQCSHLCLHVPRGYSCSCPDGSKLLLLLGEILCDAEREDPLEDPMICNCEEKEKICNASSPFSKCHCHLPCEEGESYTENYDEAAEPATVTDIDIADESDRFVHAAVSRGTNMYRVLFLLLCIIPVVICFALSFCKRPERSTPAASSPSENFDRHMGYNVPDEGIHHGYAQGGPTIVKNSGTPQRNNGLDNPLYQVSNPTHQMEGSMQLLVS